MRSCESAHRCESLGLRGLVALTLASCTGVIGAPDSDELAPAAVHEAASYELRKLVAEPREKETLVRERKGLARVAADSSSVPATAPEEMAPPRYRCAHPEARGGGQSTMRRLTRDEYLQSAAAVLGADIVQAASVQQAAAQLPSESFGDITSDFQGAPSYDQVAATVATARALAAQVSADAAASGRIFGSCAQQADAACASDFLDRYARRILRRPLEGERRAAYLSSFEAGPGSMQALLTQLLSAPEAVFHVELPRQQCSDSVCTDVRAGSETVFVDDWTVASRVSFALTGRGPDDALLDAADRGELRSAEQVRPHGVRLLEAADARRQLESVFDAWLGLRSLPTPAKVVADAAGIDAAGLAEEARRELLDYALHEVLERDADAQTLLTAREGFPRSARLAQLYGVDKVGKDGAPVMLGEDYGGLLLRIAPMLSGQERTSPIMRGVYVRKRLMCNELQSPDFSVVQLRTQALDAAEQEDLSSRQITETITSPDSCMSCHQDINPLGFALEELGPLGSLRSNEVVYGSGGKQVSEHPIDTVVHDAYVDKAKPESLANAAELVQAIAFGASYPACIAQRLVGHSQLRAATDADSCLLSEVEAALRAGESVKEAWLRSVVNADTFVRRAPEASL